jgi:hypothetical protein
MIDSFSILLSHGLILLVFWRLLGRPDLDHEDIGSDTSRQDRPDA